MNCFTLQRKGSTENVNFTEVDNEICQLFGVIPDPEDYYKNWFNIFGFALATNYTLGTPEWVNLLDKFKNGHGRFLDLFRIGMYLNENFTSNSWAERER